jgi:hypothetical protein
MTVGFEPMIPVSERVKTAHAWDRAATVMGMVRYSLDERVFLYDTHVKYGSISFIFRDSRTLFFESRFGHVMKIIVISTTCSSLSEYNPWIKEIFLSLLDRFKIPACSSSLQFNHADCVNLDPNVWICESILTHFRICFVSLWTAGLHGDLILFFLYTYFWGILSVPPNFLNSYGRSRYLVRP